MYVANKVISWDWEIITEVRNGKDFTIQNCGEDIMYYCIYDGIPTRDMQGNVLPPYQKLNFKKVAGDLYFRKGGNNGLISIETPEEGELVEKFILTIKPTPTNATVTINDEERKAFRDVKGAQANWTVSATGYTEKTGQYTLNSDHTEEVVLDIKQFNFTINPTPATATVMINGEERKTITADYNTVINWSVSANGYNTKTGTHKLEEEHTESVALTPKQYTFTVNPKPTNATVTIDEQPRKSILADFDSTVSWKVAATGYTEKNGSHKIQGNYVENVTLEVAKHTFTINATPSDAKVVINGEEVKTITANYGTQINWTVSREGYTSKSGKYTLNETHTEEVTLDPLQYTFTINPTPSDATVTINSEERKSFKTDYNTEITWSVAKSGYTTKEGTHTLTGNHTENVTLEAVPEQFTFTINCTPEDATVTINEQQRKTLTANKGTAINWTVAKEGFQQKTGSYTLNEDHTETVTLDPNPAG